MPENLIGFSVESGRRMSSKKIDISQLYTQVPDHSVDGLVDYDGYPVIFANQGMNNSIIKM
jgi:hypothetical protein